eukprot:gb/GECH01002897.1/.p1 GENE.gb/GECH01002897.1/~~gb/GECH01002897.1/.p1  ORF type:complete len:165 (+),score=23.36 gb/GECH01002897.1/:1-495(+)
MDLSNSKSDNVNIQVLSAHRLTEGMLRCMTAAVAAAVVAVPFRYSSATTGTHTTNHGTEDPSTAVPHRYAPACEEEEEETYTRRAHYIGQRMRRETGREWICSAGEEGSYGMDASGGGEGGVFGVMRDGESRRKMVVSILGVTGTMMTTEWNGNGNGEGEYRLS